jgi:prepilin-type processing-associated H-X9-DG protein
MTIIEVIVVIFVLFFLAALLLPAFVNNGKPRWLPCTINLKQLAIACLMYGEDNHDDLPQNISRNIGGGHYALSATQAGCQHGQPYASWVLGDASQPDPGFITNGLLYPYLRNLRFYKCPLDVAKNTTNGPSLRSYSLNAWMNGIPVWSTNFVTFTKPSDINKMRSPSKALAFVEENPATINDGSWLQDPSDPTIWLDSPAHQHGGGSWLSFADGHAEFKKWTDKYVPTNSFVPFASDPTSDDLAWIQSRCTVKTP